MGEMKKDDLDRALRRAFVELPEESAGEPPTVDELQTLRAAVVDEAALESQLLLDAKHFPDLEPTAEEQRVLDTFSSGTGWQSLREQLVEEGTLEPDVAPAEPLTAAPMLAEDRPARDRPAADQPVGEVTVESFPDSGLSTRRWPQWLALAAMLLIGFGLGLVVQHSGPETSENPRGPETVKNPAVIQLMAGTHRASGSEPKQARSTSGGLLVEIDVADYPVSGDSFELRLIPKDASVKPESQQVEDDRQDDILRVIWPEMPAPGLYRIELRRRGELLNSDSMRVTD